jgi:GntR family transcriptional regulator
MKRGRNGAAKAAPRPRYRRIADELTGKISAGTYPVGRLLPTELELCAKYHASRSTVREALRILRDAGLISRRRRTGTEVVAQSSPVSYRQPTNSVSDLLQYAETTRITVLSERRIICDAALARQLECRVGHAWFRVVSLRTVPNDPRPICMTTSYVDANLPDIDTRLGTVTGPISAMLEEVYGIRIARIDQSIQAVSLSRRQAARLHAEPTSPALRAIRRYYQTDGALIEVSSALHPADRFQYVTSLVRQ